MWARISHFNTLVKQPISLVLADFLNFVTPHSKLVSLIILQVLPMYLSFRLPSLQQVEDYMPIAPSRQSARSNSFLSEN